jgi:hypothetical protein
MSINHTKGSWFELKGQPKRQLEMYDDIGLIRGIHGHQIDDTQAIQKLKKIRVDKQISDLHDLLRKITRSKK